MYIILYLYYFMYNCNIIYDIYICVERRVVLKLFIYFSLFVLSMRFLIILILVGFHIHFIGCSHLFLFYLVIYLIICLIVYLIIINCIWMILLISIVIIINKIVIFSNVMGMINNINRQFRYDRNYTSSKIKKFC